MNVYVIRIDGGSQPYIIRHFTQEQAEEKVRAKHPAARWLICNQI